MTRGIVLAGLSIPDAIPLGDGLVIRRLSEYELGSLLDVGVLPGHTQAGLWHVAETDQIGLCEIVTEEKQFGEQVEAPARRRDLDACANRFRTAVRLIVGGTIAQGAIFEIHMGSVLPVRTGAAGTQPPIVNVEQPAVLDEKQIKLATDLYHQLDLLQTKQAHQLDIPLRRFRDARLRRETADSLVDLMIAAEGLLVRDQRSDLGSNLALGAAIWCGLAGVPRSAVHAFMKKTYSARSALVHAGTTKRLTRLDGSDGDLLEVVHDLERVVQAGLRRAVHEVASTGRLSHWNEQLPAVLDAMPLTTHAPD